MNVNIQSVNKIHSWAKGQINRAAGYIRQVSREFASFDEEEDSASRVRERRAMFVGNGTAEQFPLPFEGSRTRMATSSNGWPAKMRPT